MEVKGSQSGTIMISGSEVAPIRDIIQINGSEGASIIDIVQINGSEGVSIRHNYD